MFGTPRTVSTTVNRPFGLLLVDFDGDGDLDLVGTGVYDDKLSWYENLDPEGTFWPGRTIVEANGAKSIAVADINGDSVLDVAFGGPYIGWADTRGGEPATYSNSILIGGVARIKFIAPGDVDNDGDVDVVVVSETGSYVAWYENEDGLGSFGPQNQRQNRLPDRVAGASSCHLADLDGDGETGHCCHCSNRWVGRLV